MHPNILVVDDEKLSRSYLQDLIQEFVPQSVIYLAASADEALNLVNSRSIDIVFSDVRMPEASGFDLIQQIGNRDFELVFVTAYNEYAIQAIKEGAIDYLLKPINKREFKDTIEKVVDRWQKRIALKTETSVSEEYLNMKLALGHTQGIKYICLKDIVYLEAANSYTNVFLINGERIISSRPIIKFESKLDTKWFFRIHKSTIVNIFHFREYSSKDGDIAIMSDGSKHHISRYRLTQFLSAVDEASGKLRI